jgi:hypothetical protein
MKTILGFLTLALVVFLTSCSIEFVVDTPRAQVRMGQGGGGRGGCAPPPQQRPVYGGGYGGGMYSPQQSPYGGGYGFQGGYGGYRPSYSLGSPSISRPYVVNRTRNVRQQNQQPPRQYSPPHNQGNNQWQCQAPGPHPHNPPGGYQPRPPYQGDGGWNQGGRPPGYYGGRGDNNGRGDGHH